MKAVILAAGVGSRLGRKEPKPLTPLPNGRSIMEHQIRGFESFVTTDDISAVVGYKKNLIMEAFPDLGYVYNVSFDTTNTARSLQAALRRLRGNDVIWINGDVVTDPAAIGRVAEFSGSCMAVRNGEIGEEEVKYRTGPEGEISEVSKTVDQGLGEAVGINKVSAQDLPLLLECLGECTDMDYFERGVELAIQRGVRFYPVVVSDLLCVEVDFPEDLEGVNRAMKDSA